MLQHAMLALACVLGLLVGANGYCRGDGGYSCPAKDYVVPVQEGYDPNTVDWNGVVGDIYKLTEVEPRLCTMAIRAWFHDIGAHQGNMKLEDEAINRFFPRLAGADGSILTHDQETEMEHNAEHGFARVARHVLVQIAAAHGASHADVLTLFAAKCPQKMQGTVDIPQACEAAGFPLYVGKMDYSRPEGFQDFNVHHARTNQLSQPHTRIPKMYSEMMLGFNQYIPELRWQLNQRDVTALMGAHGNMHYQNCMTDGQQPGKAPVMTDRTCSGAGGTQRMFKWSNHYWQDVTSGLCNQIDPDLSAGRMNAEDDSDFTSCSWNTMEGFKLGNFLECDAMEKAKQVINQKGIRPVSEEFKTGVFADGWREANWRPDPATAAPCCGYTCQTCEEDPGSKFWCRGEIQGAARFFPYGYFDCDWNAAYRKGASYCDGDTDIALNCRRQWPGPEKYEQIRTIMDNVKPLLNRYRTNAYDWEQDYAIAFCKVSNFGANYTSTKTSVAPRIWAPTTGCLDPMAVLSPKQCRACQIDGRDPSDHKSGSVGGAAAPPPPGSDVIRVEEQDSEPLNNVPNDLPATTTTPETDCGDLCSWLGFWGNFFASQR